MFSLFVLRLFSLSFSFSLSHPLFASPEQTTLYSEVGFDESSLFDQGKQKPGPKPIRLAFIHDLKKPKWSLNSNIIAKTSTLWIEWFFSVSFYSMRIVSRVSKCIRAIMTWYKIWKTRSSFKRSCKRASARKYRTQDRNYRTCATVLHKMFYIARLPEYNGPQWNGCQLTVKKIATIIYKRCEMFSSKEGGTWVGLLHASVIEFHR